jgi:hypothetical protein
VSPRALSVVALLLAWGASRPAAANNAVALFRGERHGPLSPQRSTNLRVEREDLTFDLSDGPSDARVTAAYRMTAAAAESADVAFAFVRAVAGPRGLENVSAAVELDGAPLAFDVVTDGQILEPRLHAWIEAHPGLEAALRAAATDAPGDAAPDRLLREAGSPCAGEEGLPRPSRHQDAPLARRPDDRGARHRPRQDQGAPRPRSPSAGPALDEAGDPA